MAPLPLTELPSVFRLTLDHVKPPAAPDELLAELEELSFACDAGDKQLPWYEFHPADWIYVILFIDKLVALNVCFGLTLRRISL